MMYIRGIGHVSPLAVGNNLPTDVAVPKGDTYAAVEPEYKNYINERLLRRMARIIKMSVAASNIAMTDAGISQPDAIITGTGLGCLEDTESFLRDIISNNETLPSPTAFIKSTHNTIGGQIALMGSHYCYNMTYAHRAFSFESALLDGGLWLQEGTAQNVLVGGIDELTGVSIKMLQRLGCIAGPEFPAAPKGGEGAVFLVLGSEGSSNHYAVLQRVSMVYNSDAVQALQQFSQGHKVDLVLTGANTPEAFRQFYQKALQTVLPNANYGYYKHLCGEYHTSSAIGTMVAAQMLKEGQVPQWALLGNAAPKNLRTILIYHRTAAEGHAFILLTK